MAADAVMDFHTTLNNSGSIDAIVIKFYTKLRRGATDVILGSEVTCCKIHDGRRLPIEIY